MNYVPFDLASSMILSLPVKKLEAGIRELEWCRQELEIFDVFSVEEREDSRVEALEAATDEAISSLFDRESPEYLRFRRESLVDNAYFSLAYPTPIHEIRQGLRAGMNDQLNRLEEAISAVTEGLSLLKGEPAQTPPPESFAPESFTPGAPDSFDDFDPTPAFDHTETPAPGYSTDVFVVNSQNSTAKASVIEFLTQVDLTAIPLDNGSDSEGSLPPTFDQLRRAGFAVIVMTPDDIRTLNDPQTSPDFKPCASEEVMFELGFFIGALGPERLCVLLVDSVELSLGQFDIRVTPMDAGEGWKLDLAKMLKTAGLPIDLNRAI